MKILLATPFYPPFGVGGGPVSAHNMATTLATLGHDVRVLTVGDAANWRELDGISIQTIKSPNVYWNFFEQHSTGQKLLWHVLENYNPAAYRLMTSALKDFHPALLMTISIENINVASWAAAKALGVPVLHVLHSGYLMCWKGTLQKGLKNCERQCLECRLSSFGKRRLSQVVDGVCGETNFIINRHIAAGYFQKALARAVPSSIDQIHAKKARKLPRNRPLRVGFLGVHIPYKGLDTLAQAAHFLSAADQAQDLERIGDEDVAFSDNNALNTERREHFRGSNFVEKALNRAFEFHIAGEGKGDYAEQIRGRFPPENTTFHGWVDAAAFLPSIDILVVPSIGNEPFARVCIEAFSHAIPVLGARSGGIPENITPGVNGDLFGRGDAKALAACLKAVSRDPDLYERWSQGALTSAKSYCQEPIAERLNDLLHAILRAQKPPTHA